MSDGLFCSGFLHGFGGGPCATRRRWTQSESAEARAVPTQALDAGAGRSWEIGGGGAKRTPPATGARH